MTCFAGLIVFLLACVVAVWLMIRRAPEAPYWADTQPAAPWEDTSPTPSPQDKPC